MKSVMVTVTDGCLYLRFRWVKQKVCKLSEECGGRRGVTCKALSLLSLLPDRLTAVKKIPAHLSILL